MKAWKWWPIEALLVGNLWSAPDAHTQAVIVGSGSGEISVLSIHSLSNLLGTGQVTGWSVTPACNEQFFFLEVGRHLKLQQLHRSVLRNSEFSVWCWVCLFVCFHSVTQSLWYVTQGFHPSLRILMERMRNRKRPSPSLGFPRTSSSMFVGSLHMPIAII